MASTGLSRDVEKNQLPMFIVDAFTDRPFTGNPAAVCLVDTTQVNLAIFKTSIQNEQ